MPQIRTSTYAALHLILCNMFMAQALDAIDSKRVDGIFCGNLQHVPAGQARAAEILQSSYGAVRLLRVHASVSLLHLMM